MVDGTGPWLATDFCRFENVSVLRSANSDYEFAGLGRLIGLLRIWSDRLLKSSTGDMRGPLLENDRLNSGASLCTRCGLCCNGMLFADVELRDAEESLRVESLGIECDEEDGHELLIQPCAGLEGTRCGVYAHRPECCRTFECRVLKDYLAGRISLAEGLGLVAEMLGMVDGKDSRRRQEFAWRTFLSEGDRR